ncbi:MAG TPA: DUF134 domain-containing protein [Clostridia bacterium]|nr:DUF134 domain-containing protein [Clostridia bacterium]
MPRPRKCKRIGFIPNTTSFVPEGDFEKNDDFISMSLEELESIRLMDLLEFDQIKSAEEMNISRGTMQRILNSARKKVADSLINGKKIIISGGDYKISSCKYICEKCGDRYLENKDSKVKCPSCGSNKYICGSKKEFCLKNCNRYRGAQYE